MCVYGLKYYYIILYNIYWIFKDQNVVVPSKTNCAAGKTLFGENGNCGMYIIYLVVQNLVKCRKSAHKMCRSYVHLKYNYIILYNILYI